MELPPTPPPPPPLAVPLSLPPGGYINLAEFHARQDAEHLRLLMIFHYVVGGLTALFACLPIIHFGFGVAMALGAFHDPRHPANDPPAVVGFVIMAIAGVFILAGWTVAALTVYAGVCLKRREKRTFTTVMAAINCLFFPFGTALGVCTLIVLQRPSVQALYRR